MSSQFSAGLPPKKISVKKVAKKTPTKEETKGDDEYMKEFKDSERFSQVKQDNLTNLQNIQMQIKSAN